MIITIKTLQQKSFKVEIDEAENVSALKNKIEEEQGPGFPAAGIRLIYAGKILSDGSQISEYKIQESNFVVVMVSKAKNVPAPKQSQTTSSTPASTPAQQTTDTPQETSTSGTVQPQAAATESSSVDPIPAPTPAPTPTSTAVPPPAEPSSSEDGGGAMSTGRGGDEASGEGWQPVSQMLTTQTDVDGAIVNLMELGYEREQVLEALQASFNNPDRAAEYLTSGIPAHLQQRGIPFGAERVQGSSPPQPPPTDSSPPSQPAVGEPTGSPVSPPQGDPLSILRQQPQFQMLRATLQENPQMLPGLLQQIGQSNPQLLDLIRQNQQEFVQMLNASPEQDPGVPPGGAPGGGVGAPPGGGPFGGSVGGSGGGGALGSPMQIQVTQLEKESIDRLKAMGFPEHLVIQAYFACEKNEQMAAEFLLNQDPTDD